MTIDERLEALAQTVELLALMHKENEVRFGKLALTVDRNSAARCRKQRHVTATTYTKKRYLEPVLDCPRPEGLDPDLGDFAATGRPCNFVKANHLAERDPRELRRYDDTFPLHLIEEPLTDVIKKNVAPSKDSPQ